MLKIIKIETNVIILIEIVRTLSLTLTPTLSLTLSPRSLTRPCRCNCCHTYNDTQGGLLRVGHNGHDKWVDIMPSYL